MIYSAQTAIYSGVTQYTCDMLELSFILTESWSLVEGIYETRVSSRHSSFIVTCGMNNYQNTGLLASCIIPPIPALFPARGASPSPHTGLKLPLHLSCVLYYILCPLSPHAQGAACPLSWTGSVRLHSSSAMDSCQTFLQVDVATVSFMTPNRFLRVQLIELCFLWLI